MNHGIKKALCDSVQVSCVTSCLKAIKSNLNMQSASEYLCMCHSTELNATHFPEEYQRNDVGLIVVLYVPSTERSFRDGTPIYCPLRRT